MTTTIKVHVGGRYVARITQTDATNNVQDDPAARIETSTVVTRAVAVHGDYIGSPNPGGDYYIHVGHPAATTLTISEEYLGEAKVEPVTDLDPDCVPGN